MNNIIEQMLSKYEIKNTTDETNAMKEIIEHSPKPFIIKGIILSFVSSKDDLYMSTANPFYVGQL